MFKYKNLTPFQLFCCNNFPFIEETFDTLNTYELLCKIAGYLEKEVIPNVDNIGNSQNELIEKFNELKSYVDNYFSNLDVQDEINNKLDEMAKNGELQELISLQYNELKNEVNSSISNFENETNQDLNNFKNQTNQNFNEFQQSINNEIDILTDKINSATSGSPLVATSTAGMTDTNRIYVNTSDGKWYYYNGSNWVAGGNYQAIVLNNGSVGVYKLENLLQANFSINYSEDIDLGTQIQGYVSKDSDTGKLKITVQNGYYYYKVPIESGATYIFNAEQNVKAYACIVADTENNILYSSTSDDEAYQTSGAFSVIGNGKLYCYIGRIAKTQSGVDYKYNTFVSSNRLRKLESITNNLSINNNVVQLDELTDYGCLSITVGNMVTVQPQTGHITKIFEMRKGNRYKISAYNYYLLKGIVVTDENYKVLYSSGGTSGEKITPVNYEFTASKSGFIFLGERSSGSYPFSIEIIFNSNVINANIYPNITGKNIVYDGDSITEGRTNNGGSFPELISVLTNSTFSNEAVGGAYLSHRESGHSVVDNLENLPTNGDMYIFQGGINDFWNNVPLGELTENYSDSVNTSTIAGALEQIFRYSLSNFVGKPIVFIMTHKIQQTAINNNTAGYNMSDMNDLFIKACKKYSIPYYNAFDESGLNGWNTEQSNEFLTANPENTGDGIHPNANGYNKYYVPQLLSIYQANLQK